MRLAIFSIVLMLAGQSQANTKPVSFDAECIAAIRTLNQFARNQYDSLAIDVFERYYRQQSEILSEVSDDPNDEQKTDAVPTYTYTYARSILDSLNTFVPADRLDDVAVTCIP